MCLSGSGMCCLLWEDTSKKVSFKSLDVNRTRKSMRPAEKDDGDSDTDNDAPEVNTGLQETNFMCICPGIRKLRAIRRSRVLFCTFMLMSIDCTLYYTCNHVYPYVHICMNIYLCINECSCELNKCNIHVRPRLN